MDDSPLNVTVVGSATMDLKARASEPMTGSRCASGSLFSCPGGVARNLAETLARLSVNTRLLTATGKDSDGLKVIAQTALAGVRLDTVLQSETYPTASFVGVMDTAGNIVGGIKDCGVIELITSDYVGRHEESFRTSSLVVVDSSLPVETIQTIQKICRSHKVGLVFTPDSLSTTTRFRPFLAGSLLLALNRHEAERLTGSDTSTEEGVQSAATALLEQGPTATLVTMGAAGILYKSATENLRLPAPTKNPVDPLGAGDAYLAGFLYGYLKNLPLLKALEIGQFVSSLTLDTSHNVHPKLNLDYVHNSIV